MPWSRPGAGSDPRGVVAAELTLVGTGTLVPDLQRGSPAHHLRAAGARLLLDCGPGTTRGLLAAGIDWSRITHIALTHRHTDHTGGLAGLLWALTRGGPLRRTTPLVIVGPPGVLALRDGLVRAHGDMVEGAGAPFEVEWWEVARSAEVEIAGADGSGVRLSCHPTPHTDDSVAWRVETDAGAVGYTGDTGPSAAVGRFLAGCRVVVSECSTSDDDPRDGHLTPSTVAELARTARPERILLTHVYPPHDPAELAREAAARAAGVAVEPGGDGLRVTLDPPSPRR